MLCETLPVRLPQFAGPAQRQQQQRPEVAEYGREMCPLRIYATFVSRCVFQLRSLVHPTVRDVLQPHLTVITIAFTGAPSLSRPPLPLLSSCNPPSHSFSVHLLQPSSLHSLSC